jgi:predicted acyltransferase
MIFGLLAGRLLRSDVTVTHKIRRLAVFGLAGLAAGYALHAAGICPMVKRIWTPSWTLFSGGAVALILAGFVFIIDARGWKRWAFPLVVAGLNPITLYLMWQLMSRPTRETLQTHLGRDIFELFGAPYVPTLQRGLVLLVFWFILLAMYRKRLFLKI